MDKVDIELQGTVTVVGIEGWSVLRPWRRSPRVLVRWQGRRGVPITRSLRVGDEMNVTLSAYLMNEIDWKETPDDRARVPRL